MISFIILNYNGAKLTAKCADSIVEHMPAGTYEIVVVDNGSKKYDFAMLEKLLTKDNSLKIVRSNTNTGFGTGNMTGAANAKGEYLCFLNNDVILTQDCVLRCAIISQNMLTQAASHPYSKKSAARGRALSATTLASGTNSLATA